MTDLADATPSQGFVRDPADMFTQIVQAVDSALTSHGSKSYIEKIDFVDIILDIRKIAVSAIDLLNS